MDVHPIVAKLLSARGIGPDQYEEFFDPSLRRLVHAEDFPGVAAAVDVILPFVRDKREIVVFGDYDCDGTCASAILVTALKRLGGVADAFIPDRFAEGYGLTDAAIARLFREHPAVKLVVTVDNGVTAAPEVAALRARGVAVVVTDHHLPSGELPAADALVETRVAAAPGCANLCGAGVAFFLATALVNAAKKEGLAVGTSFAGPLLVLAGLATVADVMPITEQNRILVAQALKLFARLWPHGAPVGLRELLDRAQRRAADVTARDFGFALAPRVNAAGRMASAREAYDLLMVGLAEDRPPMAEDRETARALASKLCQRITERKTEEQRVMDAVHAELGDLKDRPAIVVYGADWNSGVVGLVASHLVEETGVPVAVATATHGSVRAPAGYNVHDALAASAAALDRFGGHAAAGGFSVKEGAFEEFKRLFSAACAAQREANAEAIAQARNPEPDAWLEPADITMDLYRDVERLQPFGEGNPEPLFGLRGVAFADVKPMGADGRHASIQFVNRSIPRAVWWGHGEEVEALRACGLVRHDVLFELFTSTYNDVEPHLELRLVEVR